MNKALLLLIMAALPGAVIAAETLVVKDSYRYDRKLQIRFDDPRVQEEFDTGNDTPDVYDWGASIFREGNVYRAFWTRNWTRRVQDGTLMQGARGGCGSKTYGGRTDRGPGGDAIFQAQGKSPLLLGHARELYRLGRCENDPVRYTGQQQAHAADPSVVKVGGLYYMFYEANRYFDRTRGHVYGSQIFLATSDDGRRWSHHPRDDDPQPIIAYTYPSTTHPERQFYGNGQPRVFYKDGEFHLFYLSKMFGNNHAEGGDRTRWAKSADPTNPSSWGTFDTHPAVSKGTALADVRWNEALERLVMVFNVRSDLVRPDLHGRCDVDPELDCDVEIHVVTSTSVDFAKCTVTWNNQPASSRLPMRSFLGPETRVLYSPVGTVPRTRFNTRIVADNPRGTVSTAQMHLVFTEGDATTPAEDFRLTHPTWDLHMLVFRLGSSADEESQPLFDLDGSEIER